MSYGPRDRKGSNTTERLKNNNNLIGLFMGLGLEFSVTDLTFRNHHSELLDMFIKQSLIKDKTASNTNFAKNVSKNMNNSQNFSFITTWSCFATFTTAGQKEAVESQYGRFLV